MSKLKHFILKKKGYTKRGSNVLKAIMNSSTPTVDLLVRESIQNSTDEIIENRSFGRVDFINGQFNKKDLLELLPDIGEKIDKIFTNSSQSFIAIRDRFTHGLLGEPYERENCPNNLYKLVYDFENGDKYENQGGSWGIGKSIYHKIGNGLVFYYSRTYESDCFQEKLAGCLIQDEKKDNCLLGKGSSGISFFGDIKIHNGEEMAWPILNRDEIHSFLNVFGIEPYDGENTGTTVIIPFVNEHRLVTEYTNEHPAYWKYNLKETLKMSIQRWWFPRLNNQNYDGKYFISIVFGEKLELNCFYKYLQDVYNGDAKNLICEEISTNKSGSSDVLGHLHYIKTKKEALKLTENALDCVYEMIDCDFEDSNNVPIFMCTRAPGMIVNYDLEKYRNIKCNADELILVLFILNDDAKSANGEKLGKYVRESEKADHMSWSEMFRDDDYPDFSSSRPIKKINKRIKSILESALGKKEAPTVETGITKMALKLGGIFLPPQGFGTLPSNGKKKPPVVNPKNHHTIQKGEVVLSKFEKKEAVFNIKLSIKPNKKGTIMLAVPAQNEDISLEEWIETGFAIPFFFSSSLVKGLYRIANLTYGPYRWKPISKKGELIFIKGIERFSIAPITANNAQHPLNTILGYEISNLENETLVLEIEAGVTVINQKMQVSIIARSEK